MVVQYLVQHYYNILIYIGFQFEFELTLNFSITVHKKRARDLHADGVGDVYVVCYDTITILYTSTILIASGSPTVYFIFISRQFVY